MTDAFLAWLKQLIASGDVHPFYVSPEWRSLQRFVLNLDLGECQLCKAKGRYRRAEIVHHVNHVKRRPDLALSVWYTDAAGEKKRNLLSVCDMCHKHEHPEQMRRASSRPKFQTEERWD